MILTSIRSYHQSFTPYRIECHAINKLIIKRWNPKVLYKIANGSYLKWNLLSLKEQGGEWGQGQGRGSKPIGCMCNYPQKKMMLHELRQMKPLIDVQKWITRPYNIKMSLFEMNISLMCQFKCWPSFVAKVKCFMIPSQDSLSGKHLLLFS